jgi:hypothetical protein
VTNASAVSNRAPVSVVPPLAATSAEKLPKGWKDFRKHREIGQLNRVTAAMENRTLPFDLLAFFEQEIFNRQHWDVTRNNSPCSNPASPTATAPCKWPRKARWPGSKRDEEKVVGGRC